MIATAHKPRFQLTHVSPSSIKSYLTCSLKYYFEKVLQLPSDTSANLLLGKSVHDGLKEYHVAVWKNGQAEVEKVKESYCKAFSEHEQEDVIRWPDTETREQLLQLGGKLIETYIANEQQWQLPRPIGVEVGVEEVDLGFKYPLVGIFDLIRSGNRIVDFKTSSRSPSDPATEAWNHEIQLTAYELLFEQATGEQIAGTELVFLVKTKQPKVIRYEFNPATETARKRFKALVNTVIEGVENERFHPSPGMHCSWCTFRQECALWKGEKL
jgi:putative RecB family exonuclease